MFFTATDVDPPIVSEQIATENPVPDRVSDEDSASATSGSGMSRSPPQGM